MTCSVRRPAKVGRLVWINVSTIGAPGGTVYLFRDVTATKELLRLVSERFSGSPAPPEDNGELTRRELQILRLVAAGESTKATAARLHVSPATVRNHVQNILSKLGQPPSGRDLRHHASLAVD